MSFDLVPMEAITAKIYLIRNQKVMLDRDLAEQVNGELRMLNEEGQRPERKDKTVSLDVIALFSTLPKTTVAQVIGKQVLRSDTSIEVN